MRKILLNKKRGKKSVNKTNFIPVELNREMSLYHSEILTETIDVLNLYNEEKDKSTKHRFIFTLYPICTNVLFNKVSEIIYKEGSPDAKIITNTGNFNTYTNGKSVSQQNFNRLQAIRNTEYSNDIFNMYVFFEITALTQVGIIIASSTEDNYEIALKYLILGAIGGPILLLGIGFILGTIGSVNINDIVFAISNNYVNPYAPSLVIGFALILFGWLYSAGLPPFHTIKSAVYSKARPNGSAILQGFSVLCMLAFGIAMYKIFAYIPYFNTAIIVFAILAMALSIAMSAMEVDFRRMIAFLAVGELGFIALGFGIGTQYSIAAALFQAANEIVITALLFIGFGTVYYLTKTSDTRKLGGLIAVDSKMAIMVLLGGFALAGVPPFNGFQSKLMLVQAALDAGYTELAVLAIIVSVVIFFTFVKAFHTVYLQPKPKDLKFAHDKIPKTTVFSVAVLLIICLALGIFPNIVTDVFIPFAGGLI